MIPRHVAIIMDGNGRWARRCGLTRRHGHTRGAESVRRVTRACTRMGVSELTLYAFSNENWGRPKVEIAFLMHLLRRFLISEREEIMDNNIRFRAIGRLSRLPRGIRAALDETVAMSAENTGMILRLALNYGGRQEIVDAVGRLLQAARDDPSIAPAHITEHAIRRYFYDQEMSDPDLLIRTGGETRLSNFLLWQLSYAELWFTKTCWPAFGASHLRQAFRAYAGRERRYGGLSSRARRRAALKQV